MSLEPPAATVSDVNTDPHRCATAHAGAGYRVWIRAARVRQWTKNLLVFAAPAAAGVRATTHSVTPLGVTYVVFCLLATGTYLANDVHDAEGDRLHPVKRHRPVASGVLAPRDALIAAGLSVGCGLALAAAVNLGTLVVASAYVALNAAYTLWLRSIAVVELVAIAGAFVLRGIAGATAADIAASRTFIAVVAVGALFVIAGKRYADFLDRSARLSRAVLDRYSGTSLRLVLIVACAATLWTYYFWALSGVHGRIAEACEPTVIPFTLLLLRYAVIACRGGGGAPEHVLFADRQLQVLGLTWLLFFATATQGI
ncbi:MAG: decaprenyl-phosphate phosphoribosyltransferase [Solirubrobacteraceae bacterium]